MAAYHPKATKYRPSLTAAEIDTAIDALSVIHPDSSALYTLKLFRMKIGLNIVVPTNRPKTSVEEKVENLTNTVPVESKKDLTAGEIAEYQARLMKEIGESKQTAIIESLPSLAADIVSSVQLTPDEI